MKTLNLNERHSAVRVGSFGLAVALFLPPMMYAVQDPAERPNILIAISDDQSWLHAGAYGCRAVKTPALDRVARSGVLFENAITASPGCSPCRASLLTGRHHWQIEHAGTHASSFPTRYVTFPDVLEGAGYFVGMTGKGWGPGNYRISGRLRNPAGPSFTKRKVTVPHKGINANDYASNFADFLEARPPDQPFCFWYGASEPHRVYEPGVGEKLGKKLSEIEVPPFLPDAPEVRSDIADYLAEIEWFDRHLDRMLSQLEQAGELADTLVIVTSDNGMPFPRAKANLYEYGIHMPLAIAWPAQVPGGRTVDDVIGFVDITATILDAARVEHPGRRGAAPRLAGNSFLELLRSGKSGLVEGGRRVALSGRERHSSSRADNLGYPGRALRTDGYLYIRNFHPERWPAGDPQTLGNPLHRAYHDIDGGPSLSFLVDHREQAQWSRFFHWAVDQRPGEELFDIRGDPGCLKNLALDAAYGQTLKELRAVLEEILTRTGDPRMGKDPEIFDTYPRYSPIRKFPPSP